MINKIRVINKIGLPLRGRPICLSPVLLPINENYDETRETNKPSIERWAILKRHYEWLKTQQFTQQSSSQQRAQMTRIVQL